MATRFSIDATFRAIDKMTAPVKKMADSVKRNVKTMSSASRADIAKVRKSVTNLGRSFKGMGKRIKGAMSGILGPLAAVFSVAKVMQFGNASIDAFKKQESAIANVEAGLKSTNNALGLTSKELQNIAAAQQQAGIFGDEDILQNATAQLLTFGGIGKEVFGRTQQAAQDIAAKLKGVDATGSDLRSTSIMLGKALEDPIRGMGALRRVGISFTTAQEKQIKTMIRAGKSLEAQQLMLGLIEKQYGGTAEALAGTDSGRIINAQNKISDSMENIGKKLLPLKAGFLSFVQSALPHIEKLFGFLVDVLGVLKKFAPIILTVVGAFLAYNAALKIQAGIELAIAGAKVAHAIATGQLTMAQIGLNVAMLASPMTWIILGIMALIGVIVLLVIHWDTVKAAMVSFWEKLVGWFMIGINWVIEFKGMLLLILGPFGLIINVIIELVRGWGLVTEAFKTGGILGAIKAIGSLIFGAILTPIQQVLNLVSKIPGVGKFAAGASDALSSFAASAGVQTQSQTTSQATQTNNNNQTVTLRNEAAGVTANSGGRDTKTGQSLSISASGA